MKIVILAGGQGTRLSEETDFRPKPMIEIGGYPVLWHIMKIYSHFGFNDFIICLGYKGYMIKEYFTNYYLHMSDVTIDIKSNKMEIHQNYAEPWKITLVDTGTDTMTGGRIKRIQPYIKDETFMLTYGDGLGDINIDELLKFHKSNGRYTTLTAFHPFGRFGALDISAKGEVLSFREKPEENKAWINGGFFVLEPEVFKYIKGDDTVWEREPLEDLAKDHELLAFQHRSFWMCMDTLRDKRELEKLWASGNAPWKMWRD